MTIFGLGGICRETFYSFMKHFFGRMLSDKNLAQNAPVA